MPGYGATQRVGGSQAEFLGSPQSQPATPPRTSTPSRACESAGLRMSRRALQLSWSTTQGGRPELRVYAASGKMLTLFDGLLTQHLGYAPMRAPVQGPDQLVSFALKGELRLELGWDVFSGAYVFAADSGGDEDVQQLAGLLLPLLAMPEVAQEYTQDF